MVSNRSSASARVSTAATPASTASAWASTAATQTLAPQWIGDPWPDSPGFPLPYTPPDGSGRLDSRYPRYHSCPLHFAELWRHPLEGPQFVNIGDSSTTTFYGTTWWSPASRNAVGFAPAVAAQVKLPPRDAACPGAGIENYWHTMKSFQFPVPKMPQRLAINKDTQLVVVSLGGNDAYTESMVALALTCVASWASPTERLSSTRASGR
ncbi:MAG: hypothetical protein U1U88_001380 [Lawsonella clevelandensis]